MAAEAIKTSERGTISPQIVRELLQYDPKSGKLFWRPRSLDMFPCERSWKWWNVRFSGKAAFAAPDGRGYLQGKILNCRLLAHQVIWVIQTGSWTDLPIDHINGVRDDNRWQNLRVATHVENMRNRKMSANNSSGVNGVYWHKASRKWMAYVGVNGKGKYLGTFNDLEAAKRARDAANDNLGFSARHGT